MFVQQGSMKPFNDAVALRPPDLCRTVLDLFELEEKFEGVMIRSSAILSPVVAEDRLDFHGMLFEEREYLVVQHMDCGDGDLGGVEIPPGVPGMTIDDRLEINLSDAL